MTEDRAYAQRLQRLESTWWKRWFDVQAPYRWSVRRLCQGRVLDVGCGVGRNLSHLSGRGVGVDHNVTAVSLARERGLTAFTPGEFSVHALPGSFDTLLAAHVLEHLDVDEGEALLRTYLPCLRPGGRVVLITPQERGWRSDETHVRWMGPAELRSVGQRLSLHEHRLLSFPFPRCAGRFFAYNEFIFVATALPSGTPEATSTVRE